MLKNNISEYGLIAKIFHWVTFLLLLAQIPFGFYLSSLEFSTARIDFENYHNIFGVIIFYFVLLRLIWKFFNKTPKTWTSKRWQFYVSKLVHFFMYLFIFAISLSGILKKFYIEEEVDMLFFKLSSSNTNFKLSDFYSELHEISTIILILLFIIHVLAVVYHYMFTNNKVLKKII